MLGKCAPPPHIKSITSLHHIFPRVIRSLQASSARSLHTPAAACASASASFSTLTPPRARQYRHEFHTRGGIFACVGVAAGLLAAASHQQRQRSARAETIAADNIPTTPSEELDWRQYFKGTYENRIRDLSTPEKIFSTFASVHKPGDEPWVKYMTVDDFVHAVLPFDFRNDDRKPSFSAENTPEFFKLVDMDKDGLISQAEYVLFSTLLSIPENRIEIAFKMFDLDGSGAIERDEFNKLFEVMRPESLSAFSFQTATHGAHLLNIFFGEKNDKRLELHEFRSFIKTLRKALLEMEFRRYDVEGTGKMSPKHFAMSIIGYCSRAHIPTYLKRLKSLTVEGEISQQEFLDFNRALPRLEDVGLALRLFSKSKKFISKSDFQRAVWAVAGVLLTETQVDVIFHIFDANNDGNLEQDELLGALKQRYENKQFHNRDVGFVRTMKCCVACMSRDQ